MMGRLSFFRMLDPIYLKHRDKKMVGFHSFGRPSLLINDLDLAKQILITDFDQFSNRRPFEVKVFHAQFDDIFRKLLVSAEGEEWKQIRSLLSPIYTSAKLRKISKFISE